MQVDLLCTSGGNAKRAAVALRAIATLWKHPANRQYLVTGKCTRAVVHSAQQHTVSAKVQLQAAELLLAFALDARWHPVGNHLAPICSSTLQAARSHHPDDRSIVAAVDAALRTMSSSYPHAATQPPLVHVAAPCAPTCAPSVLPSASSSLRPAYSDADGCKPVVPMSAPRKVSRSLFQRPTRTSTDAADYMCSSSTQGQARPRLMRRILGSWQTSPQVPVCNVSR